MSGASHVYSNSALATRKRMVDLQITGGDADKEDEIDMNSEAYLKQLIKVSSRGKIVVSDHASKLQFFIIKGGAEGFLDASYQNRNAENLLEANGDTTSGQGVSMRFSDTDLLVVFDGHGKFISSARLSRPVWINDPSRKRPLMWSEQNAADVYGAWDGARVSLYRNTNFDIKYYGLKMDDKRGYYRTGRYRVDLHKQEATNGCIFIVDPDTPDYPSDNDKAGVAKLNDFEPQLIKDVQESISAKAKENIGVMRMVEIQTPAPVLVSPLSR